MDSVILSLILTLTNTEYDLKRNNIIIKFPFSNINKQMKINLQIINVITLQINTSKEHDFLKPWKSFLSREIEKYLATPEDNEPNIV